MAVPTSGPGNPRRRPGSPWAEPKGSCEEINTLVRMLRSWMDEAGVSVERLHGKLLPEHLTDPAHHDDPDRVPAAQVPSVRRLRDLLNGPGLTLELVLAVADVCTTDTDVQTRREKAARGLWKKAETAPSTPVGRGDDLREILRFKDQLLDKQDRIEELHQALRSSEQAHHQAQQISFLLYMFVGRLANSVSALERECTTLRVRSDPDPAALDTAERRLSRSQAQHRAAVEQLRRAEQERDEARRVAERAAATIAALRAELGGLHGTDTPTAAIDERTAGHLPAIGVFDGRDAELDEADDVLARTNALLDAGHDVIKAASDQVELADPDERLLVGEVLARADQRPTVARAEVVPPADPDLPIPALPRGQERSNITPVDGFVGRARELARLDVAFDEGGSIFLSGVVQVLHGMGGVGKSALARQWAAQRSDMAVRWWITADSEAAVDAGLAQLAVALQPGLAGLPSDVQTEQASEWLSANTGWLLVLDHVEDPDHIRSLLRNVRERIGRSRRSRHSTPAGDPGVLVTTRCSTGWEGVAREKTAGLDVLDPGESVELFARVLTHAEPSRDGAGAAQLCEKLGHLALAVEQAAVFCAAGDTAPAALLDMLGDASGDTPEGAQHTLALLWRLALDRMTPETPLAGEVLRRLAWYAPDSIPLGLIDGLGLAHTQAQAVARLAAFRQLTDNGDGTVSVHPLMQALARTPSLDDPHRRSHDVDRAREDAARRLREELPDDEELQANWPCYRALLPHVDALARHTTPADDTRDMALLLDRAVRFRHTQGADAETALPYVQRTFTTTERLLGPDNDDTLDHRHMLAATYRQTNHEDQAIPLFEQNLATFLRVLGPDHAKTLSTRHWLAGAYLFTGAVDGAVAMYHLALDDAVRVLGPGHRDTLTIRNSLAETCVFARDFDRAVSLHEQNIDSCTGLFGPDDHDTLRFRGGLAEAYWSAGDFERAIDVFERTLADCVRVLGRKHQTTVNVRDNLARCRRGNTPTDLSAIVKHRTSSDADTTP